MSNARKKIWVSVGVLVLVLLLPLYAIYPRTISSLMGQTEDILQSYMLVEGVLPATGVLPVTSVDLSKDDVCSLLERFSQTRVQLCGMSQREDSSGDGAYYRLYFVGKEKRFEVVFAGGNNSFFYKGNKYRILGEAPEEIVLFLKAVWEDKGR